MDQLLRAAKAARADENVQFEVVRKVGMRILNSDLSLSTAEFSSLVYHVIEDLTGVEDPYSEIKKQHNDSALTLYPTLDLGAFKHVRVEDVVETAGKKEFAINDSIALKKAIIDSPLPIIFLADNAGEIVFDKLLMVAISKLRENVRMQVVVKKKPVVNDVTLKEAYYVGLERLKNTEVESADTSCPEGIEALRAKVNSAIEGNGVVLAKGQGNYEILSESKGVFFLLVAKCKVAARALNVEVGDFVLKYNL
jgi:uncharacterized protein with ATP-grasp and redox domains